MSDSTQLVPYIPIPDFFYQQDLSSLISAAFDEWEKSLEKGKKESEKTDFEKLAKSFENLNTLVLSPLAKVGSWLENRFSGMEQNAQAAQSLDVDLTNYKALQYGASQSGANSKGLDEAIKNVSAFANGGKANQSLLESLGVATHDDKGQKLDGAGIFSQVSRSLGSLDKDKAGVYADALGIDGDTLQAMQSGLGQYAEDYQNIASQIGGSAEQSAEQAQKFMSSWREAGAVFDALVDKSGGGLAEKLAHPIDLLSEKMLAKAPQIEMVLDRLGGIIETFAGVFVEALSGTIDWVTDVVAWWNNLDEGSQSLIAGLAGLTAAWLLVNSAFLASPIGIILSLAAAIGLLYSDYQKWKSGEESFIDWGEWGPVIEMAADVIGFLANTIKQLIFDIGNLLGINFSNWSISAIFKGLLDSFNQFGAVLRQVGNLLNALKDGNWSEVVNIGKSLISTAFQDPVANLANNITDEALKENLSKHAENFNAMIADAGINGASGKLSNAVNNLSQPDALTMMLPGNMMSSERFATQSDFSTASNSTTHSPTINSNTNIVVNGVSDPYLAATETQQRQFNVNSQLAQDYSPRMS